MASYSNVRARSKCNRFAEYNGIEITKIDTDYAEGELCITEASLNPMGKVHGGCLASLADTVAGVAVATRGRVGVTMDCRIDYLRPASGAKIKCVATPRKVGKTIAVYTVEMTNDTGVMVAIGTFSFYLTDQPLPDFEAILALTKNPEQ